MKNSFRIAICLLVAFGIAKAERQNQQIVITAGTSIRVSVQKKFVNRLSIQSKHGNTGLVYVMLGVPISATCSASNTAHLSLELGPGDATHPGQSMSDPQGANGGTPPDAEDLALACIDGTVNDDVVILSYWRRN